MIKSLPPYVKEFVGKPAVINGLLWHVTNVDQFFIWIETRDGDLGHRFGAFKRSITLEELLPALITK